MPDADPTSPATDPPVTLTYAGPPGEPDAGAAEGPRVLGGPYVPLASGVVLAAVSVGWVAFAALFAYDMYGVGRSGSLGRGLLVVAVAAGHLLATARLAHRATARGRSPWLELVCLAGSAWCLLVIVVKVSGRAWSAAGE